MHDKNEYVIHLRKLKEAPDHGLVLLKVQRVIKLNQTAWLKSYIDLNTDKNTDMKTQKIITKKIFSS